MYVPKSNFLAKKLHTVEAMKILLSNMYFTPFVYQSHAALLGQIVSHVAGGDTSAPSDYTANCVILLRLAPATQTVQYSSIV